MHCLRCDADREPGSQASGHSVRIVSLGSKRQRGREEVTGWLRYRREWGVSGIDVRDGESSAFKIVCSCRPVLDIPEESVDFQSLVSAIGRICGGFIRSI